MPRGSSPFKSVSLTWLQSVWQKFTDGSLKRQQRINTFVFIIYVKASALFFCLCLCRVSVCVVEYSWGHHHENPRRLMWRQKETPGLIWVIKVLLGLTCVNREDDFSTAKLWIISHIKSGFLIAPFCYPSL